MYLPTLSDDELLSHHASTVDDLTTTAMEKELYARLAQRVEDEINPDMQALVENGWDDVPQALDAMLKTLAEFDITPGEPNLLREKLERSDAFYSLAADAGDLFQRLQALAAKTL